MREDPEIPEIPLPALNTPHPNAQTVEQKAIIVPTEATVGEPAEGFVLEELEDVEPQVKRRRQQKLIIDKKTELSTEYMRVRIDDISVQLRCQDSSEDVVNIRVPARTYLSRPAHAGYRSNMSQVLSRLFLRNLRVLNRTPMADREMEAKRCRTMCYVPYRHSRELVVEEAVSAHDIGIWTNLVQKSEKKLRKIRKSSQ
ncbi:unnamed protein product [Parnassius apollo]|uniref:(apollo) hypothetical protein n=1 Tax=Parnassius apollo TaxID=110799 RepID=A0A8S3X2B6_PARAO|nr:unnamed protein product [Parnassius apollo]